MPNQMDQNFGYLFSRKLMQNLKEDIRWLEKEAYHKTQSMISLEHPIWNSQSRDSVQKNYSNKFLISIQKHILCQLVHQAREAVRWGC